MFENLSSNSLTLSTFARSCAYFTEVVHVSHAPLITFVFNCCRMDGWLSLGALNQTIPIYIYIYTVVYTLVINPVIFNSYVKLPGISTILRLAES